jgi:hypothetical protein
LHFAGTHASAGKTQSGIDSHTQVWRVLAGGGSAGEFSIAKKRDCCPCGSGRIPGLLDHIIENEIKSKVY